MLRVDGGLVVDRAIVEVKEEAGGYTIAVDDFEQLTGGDHGAGLIAEDEEAALGALLVTDGDGLGCGSGRAQRAGQES